MLFTGLGDEKLAQLKIYYLFMNADGERTVPEMKRLDEIIAEIKPTDEAKKEFYSFCGQLMFEHGDAQMESILNELDKIVAKSSAPSAIASLSGSMSSIGSILNMNANPLNSNKVLQAQTMWTLINLGYADSEYSDNERQFVDHLTECWGMDPELIAEFNDTAESILALSLQREREESSGKPYKEVVSVITEIDQKIASLFENIKTSISEAGI